jgi:hypothetical protein
VRLWDLSGEGKESREYLEQARVGAFFGLDVSVYPWDRYGLGILHSRFQASASDNDIGFPDSSRGKARDEYEVHFVSPSLFIRHPLADGRLTLVSHAGLGLLFYRNESPAGKFPGILEGRTWGVQAGTSVDYRILPWLGAGLGIRVLYGALDEVHYNAMETSIPTVSLSRVDLMAGVRFYP